MPLRSLLNFFLKIHDYIPDVKSVLLKHKNKVMCLEITGFPAMYFKIATQSIHVVPKQSADVTIQGAPLHLLQILFFGNQIGLLDIQGDITLAQDLFECYQQRNVDLPLFNDVLQMLSRRREDLSFFLKDEVQLTISAENAENFYRQIDALRNQTDRLEAKIKLLENRINT